MFVFPESSWKMNLRRGLNTDHFLSGFPVDCFSLLSNSHLTRITWGNWSLPEVISVCRITPGPVFWRAHSHETTVWQVHTHLNGHAKTQRTWGSSANTDYLG